jgi:hypothetical protein
MKEPKMLSTAEWGRRRKPPISESYARALAPSIKGAKRVGAEKRFTWLIPEGAKLKTRPVGRPKNKS